MRLYKNPTIFTQQPPPVILIHGFAGSRLWDKQENHEIWYENIQKIIFSAYKSLALEFDPDSLSPRPNQAEVTGVIGEVAGFDYYQEIIETLISFGNYQLTEAGEKQQGFNRRLYIFSYDWRQDNVISARELSEFIKQIQTDHNNPNLKVDIIAHSMGGLVARYYLRFGELDVLQDQNIQVPLRGADTIRKVILLGTPNTGSVGPVKSMASGYRIGVRTMPPEVIATMPSVYQMFPLSAEDWLIDIEGNAINRSAFDIQLWQDFQWSIFQPKIKQRVIESFADLSEGEQYYNSLVAYFARQLSRAEMFAKALSLPYPQKASHEIIAMGGNCNLTPKRILAEEFKGIRYARIWPNTIKQPVEGLDYDSLMLEPGDGSVTKSSLIGRSARINKTFSNPYFLCEDHARLPSNSSFQDNLLHILLIR